jgi:hypothetical protein
MINNFSRKLGRLVDNLEEYCRVGQATDGNRGHKHYMLDN